MHSVYLHGPRVRSPQTRAARKLRVGLLLLFYVTKFGNPQKLNLQRQKRR